VLQAKGSINRPGRSPPLPDVGCFHDQPDPLLVELQLDGDHGDGLTTEEREEDGAVGQNNLRHPSPPLVRLFDCVGRPGGGRGQLPQARVLPFLTAPIAHLCGGPPAVVATKATGQPRQELEHRRLVRSEKLRARPVKDPQVHLLDEVLQRGKDRQRAPAGTRTTTTQAMEENGLERLGKPPPVGM
jgi:hypothetical protein